MKDVRHLTIAEALAEQRLHIPIAEARLLLKRILGVSASELAAHSEDMLAPDVAKAFAALVQRRQAGEPIAYLTGEREFYGRLFQVSPAVLIPRPETEMLIDLIYAAYQDQMKIRVLDLGTGSACIAVTLALLLPQAEIVAVDLSEAALTVARSNAHRWQAAVDFYPGDWWAALPLDAALFDCIVANPPYVAAADAHLDSGDLRFEPKLALVGGADGLEALRHIIADAPTYLRRGGALVVEHGFDQSAVVTEMMAAAGFCNIKAHRDCVGILRVATGER